MRTMSMTRGNALNARHWQTSVSWREEKASGPGVGFRFPDFLLLVFGDVDKNVVILF